MFCPSLKWRVIAQKWTVEVTIAKNLLGHLVPSSEQRRIENTLQEILTSAVFVFLFLPYSFFSFIVIIISIFKNLKNNHKCQCKHASGI